jgi:hypothetical protein
LFCSVEKDREFHCCGRTHNRSLSSYKSVSKKGCGQCVMSHAWNMVESHCTHNDNMLFTH